MSTVGLEGGTGCGKLHLWAGHDAFRDLHDALPPTRVEKAGVGTSVLQLRAGLVSFDKASEEVQLRDSRVNTNRNSFALTCSQLHSVTLMGEEARIDAGIPKDADTFCFAYPASELNWDNMTRYTLRDSNRACLLPLAGGFVYFDRSGSVCGINAVLGMKVNGEENEGDATGDTQDDKSKVIDGKFKSALLQFAAPQPLPARALEQLRLADRLRPVTLAALLERGASQFAWILPGEKLDGMKGGTQAGAFAYIMNDTAMSIFFAVAAS